MSNTTLASSGSTTSSGGLLETIESDLEDAWGELVDDVEDAGKDVWTFFSGFLTSFSADEMQILVGAAEKAVTDFVSNPALVLAPEAEVSTLLNYLGGQEVLELSKVTTEVATAVLSVAKINANVASPATPAAAAQTAKSS